SGPSASCSRTTPARWESCGRSGPPPVGPTRRPSRSTSERCGFRLPRTPPWSTTAGWRAAACGPTVCATPGTCGRPSRLPSCTCTLPQTARGAGRYVEGPYRWRVIDGAGHFPHEERPEVLDTELLGWLADPEPER